MVPGEVEEELLFRFEVRSELEEVSPSHSTAEEMSELPFCHHPEAKEGSVSREQEDEERISSRMQMTVVGPSYQALALGVAKEVSSFHSQGPGKAKGECLCRSGKVKQEEESSCRSQMAVEPSCPAPEP